MTDDGRGIDPACIRRSAIEKGVIDAEQAARLSDQEAVNLIFMPASRPRARSRTCRAAASAWT